MAEVYVYTYIPATKKGLEGHSPEWGLTPIAISTSQNGTWGTPDLYCFGVALLSKSKPAS
jgi:hypothetical protein